MGSGVSRGVTYITFSLLGTTVEMCRLLDGLPFSRDDMCSIVNISTHWFKRGDGYVHGS